MSKPGNDGGIYIRLSMPLPSLSREKCRLQSPAVEYGGSISDFGQDAKVRVSISIIARYEDGGMWRRSSYRLGPTGQRGFDFMTL